MPRLLRSLLGAAIALAISTAAPRAHADDDATAAQFFKAGMAAHSRHEYRAAALAFEEAFRRAPRGPTIYNAGIMWEAAKEPARAADDYARAVAQGGLDGDQAATAAARLRELEASLGR